MRIITTHFSFPYKLIVICLSISFFLVQMGCAHYQLPPSVSEETRAKFGTIGIVSADFIPESNLFTFAKGRTSGAIKGLALGTGAGTAAGAGIAAGLAEVTGIAAPLWLSAPVIGPAILIIVAASAITGAVVGTAKAISEEKVKEIETKLNKALAELKIQETLRDRVHRIALEQTQYRIVLFGGAGVGPASADKDISYLHLADRGIDTVLEISVLSIGF